MASFKTFYTARIAYHHGEKISTYKFADMSRALPSGYGEMMTGVRKPTLLWNPGKRDSEDEGSSNAAMCRSCCFEVL